MTDEQLIERVARDFLPLLGYPGKTLADAEHIWVGNNVDDAETGSLAYLCLALAQAAISALPSTQADDEVREELEETYAAMRWIYEHGVVPAPLRPQWVSNVFNKAFASQRIARRQDDAALAKVKPNE